MFNKTILLFLFSTLSLALALSPALSTNLSKNYFFVDPNNHLSFELYQTRNGIISHGIEALDEINYLSRYVLIDLSTKDAKPILSDIVTRCEIETPVFQHLHYHVQTDSLVYFCATISSLFLIDQSTYTIQTVIPCNIKTTWPVAKLSTDGMSVAILAMDNLYSKNPQASALFKVDMSTKKLTTQILLDQNFANGEAVVAYASGKKGTYIATNRIQGTDLNTTVYSIITIGSTYQLTPVSSYAFFFWPWKVITKLFCVGNYIVVNNGPDVYFLNQQGKTVQSAQTVQKFMHNYDDKNGLNDPGITAQDGSNILYLLGLRANIGKYTVLDTGIIQVKELEGDYGDMQIAFGNTTSGDLAFTLDSGRIFFKVWDLQTFKNIYFTLAGYFDLMQTDATYAVVKGLFSLEYQVYIFDLKTDALIAQVPISTKKYYFNKDQQMITLLNTTLPSGCALIHIDLVSGKVWTTLSFTESDPICSSFVVNARITKKGNPEVLLPFNDHYLVISEAYGQLTFKTTSSSPVDFDSLNINFDDLSAYYLVSNQDTQQVTASLYAFDSKTKTFQLQKTNVMNDTPVNKLGFFAINSDTSVAISTQTFAVIKKLDAPVNLILPNNFNLATSFQDAAGNQYALLAHYDEVVSKGPAPALFTTVGNFVSLPGSRLNTVSGRATGSQSFALHDSLSQTIGLIRFYKTGPSKATTQGFLSNLRPQVF